METAPILLFTFKRLDTLKRTVEHLLANELAKESDLIIFSDQALRDNDKPRVSEVRDYLRTIGGFKSIRIVEAGVNLGLARSIINGVTEAINVYGKAIVLEDDLFTTPNFLSYMNQALQTYQKSPSVFSISGYAMDLQLRREREFRSDAYFLNRGASWGWATWKDRWSGIDWSMQDYAAFSVNTNAKRRFAEGGSDLNSMLRRQMNGALDSWAIRWYYHQFKVGGMTLYPVLSKVFNDGFDENATHTKGSDRRYRPDLDDSEKTVFVLPEELRVNSLCLRRFQKKMGIPARIIGKLYDAIDKIIK